MKEERPDSRSSISVTSDPGSDLSSDRATPDQEMLVKSSYHHHNNHNHPTHHKSGGSLSFGISRLLNSDSKHQSNSGCPVAASDTDDDAKSVHSSASGQVSLNHKHSSGGQDNSCVIRVPAAQKAEHSNHSSSPSSPNPPHHLQHQGSPSLAHQHHVLSSPHGFPASAYSASSFPWFGSHPFLSKDGSVIPSKCYMISSLISLRIWSSCGRSWVITWHDGSHPPANVSEESQEIRVPGTNHEDVSTLFLLSASLTPVNFNVLFQTWREMMRCFFYKWKCITGCKNEWITVILMFPEK